MKKRSIILLPVIASLFLGCGTLNVAEISNPNNKLAIEPLDMKMGFEVYNLRIDLFRNTTIHSSTGANGVTTTQTVKVPYHPLGIYLFEGVFLDINRNLCLNVIDLVDNTYKKDFEVGQNYKMKRNPGFFYKVKREGNEAKLEHKGFVKNNTSLVSFNGNLVTIEPSGLSASRFIEVKQDTLLYYAKGMIGKTAKAQVIKTQEGILVPRFGRDYDWRQTDQNTIVLDKYTTIKYYGNKVEFIYKGALFGGSSVFTLQKLTDGYIYYDSRRRGVRIKTSQNKIFVEENGHLVNYFEILK